MSYGRDYSIEEMQSAALDLTDSQIAACSQAHSMYVSSGGLRGAMGWSNPNPAFVECLLSTASSLRGSDEADFSRGYSPPTEDRIEPSGRSFPMWAVVAGVGLAAGWLMWGRK